MALRAGKSFQGSIGAPLPRAGKVRDAGKARRESAAALQRGAGREQLAEESFVTRDAGKARRGAGLRRAPGQRGPDHNGTGSGIGKWREGLEWGRVEKGGGGERGREREERREKKERKVDNMKEGMVNDEDREGGRKRVGGKRNGAGE